MKTKKLMARKLRLITMKRWKTLLCILLCMTMLIPSQTVMVCAAADETSDEEFIPVNYSSTAGLVTSTGELLGDTIYSRVRGFSEGLAAVCTNKKWGYVDTSGELVIKQKFSDCSNFSEGLAAVKKGGKWGFINTSGKYVVKPTYQHVGDFSCGMAWVQIKK
jgi:hypothetical protein